MLIDFHQGLLLVFPAQLLGSQCQSLLPTGPAFLIRQALTDGGRDRLGIMVGNEQTNIVFSDDFSDFHQVGSHNGHAGLDEVEQLVGKAKISSVMLLLNLSVVS